MKKGEFAKCVWQDDHFTVGKNYEVLAGEGDCDISVTHKHVPIESMSDSSFNVRDDKGDIRFVCLNGPYSNWEPAKRQMKRKTWLAMFAGCVIFWLVVLSMFW